METKYDLLFATIQAVVPEGGQHIRNLQNILNLFTSTQMISS